MVNCREYDLDNVMAVTAIPVSDIPATTPSSPVLKLTPTIPDMDFAPYLNNAIVVGLNPAVPGGALIPIIHSTGKAQDDEGDEVAGRLHTVEVTCRVDSRNSETWDLLRLLERTPRHLLLSFRSGTRALVAATKDTYLCTVQRDGALTNLSFRIQNIPGIQLIV